MSQHLEDRVLTDLAFDLLDAKAAAAAKRHLQGCKVCKARQKTLRATIGQLDATKKDFVASEDLIARTLRKTRGESAPSKQAPIAAPVEKVNRQESPAPDPVVTVAPPAVTEAAPVILDFPPRKDVLEMSRFFWLSAAAALVVAGIVGVSTFTQEPKSAAVVAVNTEKPMDAKDAPRAADKLIAHAPEPASVFRADEAAGSRRETRVEASPSATAVKSESKKLPGAPMTLAMGGEREDRQAGRAKDAEGLLQEKRRDTVAMVPKPMIAASEQVAPPAAAAPPPLAIAPAAAPRVRTLKSDVPAKENAPAAPATAPAMPLATAVAKSVAPAERTQQVVKAPRKSEPIALASGGAVAADAALPTEMPTAQAYAAPVALRGKIADDLDFNVQTISFVLPSTSGAWVLQQNVRVRTSVSDEEARMDVSNHGALSVLFQLMPRRGTNVLRQFVLDAGAATNFIQRTR